MYVFIIFSDDISKIHPTNPSIKELVIGLKRPIQVGLVNSNDEKKIRLTENNSEKLLDIPGLDDIENDDKHDDNDHNEDIFEEDINNCYTIVGKQIKFDILCQTTGISIKYYESLYNLAKEKNMTHEVKHLLF